MRFVRVLAALACVSALTACESAPKFGDFTKFGNSDKATADASEAPDSTGSISGVGEAPAPKNPELLGSDPQDDLSLGKLHFRQENYGQAEHYFRRAVEARPRDGEAWLGLAAAYDRLKRFDLADRAYAKALSIVGPTAEVLNNQGYSYMLRGDYAKARSILTQAQTADPANPYVKNNLTLLTESARKTKGLRQ
jgi:Flp pilus assembly protein TadD